MSESLVVRLVRHAETASYEYDAGLTPRGRAQAHEGAAQLAHALHAGSRVDIVYAPTERARETAHVLHQVLQQRAAHDRLDVGECAEDSDFRNLQVAVDEVQLEPTQAREFITKGGKWAREAEGFWLSPDPMGYWMSTPMLFHEPPASVVRRFLTAIVKRTNRRGDTTQLIVAAHSGCMRALVAWAAGSDLGEPDNVEEVLVALQPNNTEFRIAFRGHSWTVPVLDGSEGPWFRATPLAASFE